MIRARPFWYLFGASILLGGCTSDVQSVMNPSSLQAVQIVEVAWFLFGFGTFVLVLVIVTLLLAIRGPLRIRQALARESTVIWLGIAFPAVTLTVLLVYGVWVTRSYLNLPRGGSNVSIEVVGEQWWWRVMYHAPTGPQIASANEIRIPVGSPVTLKLRAADVIHSFWVPSLGGKVDMIPGRMTQLQLTVDRPGVYRGQCAEYCGGPHALMAVDVIAMSSSDYAAWLERAATVPATPETDIGLHGRSIFLAAGCGACHTVRGTAAEGSVGPDLTHIGARRSVGIDTLPLTRENLMRFIVDGQHVKPGNLMPEFRALQPQQLEALASYLLSLKAAD
ncbi:cytochrome c oxidase subunit 2 [Bradyrhizobium sp. AZCC 1719]